MVWRRSRERPQRDYSRGTERKCIAAAIRDCVADPNRLRTLAAASHVQNEFTTGMLGQICKILAQDLVIHVKSMTPFSLMFVFYTVRGAFVHGHE